MMKNLVVEANKENMGTVNDFINAQLEEHGCSMKTQMQIELAVEEVFVNIASYAYGPEGGNAEIGCQVMKDPLRVVIRFADQGIPFNPLEKEEADTSPEALKAREG